MSYLNKLIGKSIIDIQIAHGTYYSISSKESSQQIQILDELCIDFSDYKLTISAPASLKGVTEINSLIGTTVKDLVESEIEIVLTTTAGSQLIVDLRPEAYVGPEAMSLIGPNNLCVVWN